MKAHTLIPLFALALAGCVGPQYFYSTTAGEISDQRIAPAHPVFSSADNIALITRGGGYQTTDVHVEVFRQSDGKRVYSGTHADTPNGKLHFWTLKLPPGKYTARSFIGPVETQVFDFLVLP